jgi:hypothetical protein
MAQILETPMAKENRILVIENEIPLLELIGSYLRDRLNCEVHCAADREEAEALHQLVGHSSPGAPQNQAMLLYSAPLPTRPFGKPTDSPWGRWSEICMASEPDQLFGSAP